MPLDQIDLINRLRPVDPDHVEVQAASMRERGLDQAIVVRPSGDRFRLVAGAHRYTAAQLLGWETIRAEVRRLTDEEARLVEIDENLVRRGLDALDRALSLAERKLVFERLYPSTRHGGDRTAGKFQTLELAPGLQRPERFTKDAAQKTGFSEAAIYAAIEIGRDLSPVAIRHLRETKLTNNASVLRAIAREPSGVQVQIARRLASGEARSLSEAREQLGLSLPQPTRAQNADPEQVRLVLFGNFTRAFEATEGDPELRARCLSYLRKSGVRV